MPTQRKLVAYAAPMLLFVLLLSLAPLLRHLGNQFWFRSAEYWIYPLQTISCGGMLIWFWRDYDFGQSSKIWLVIAAGIAVFLIWISPQQFFGFAARLDGFNPDVFAERGFLYWSTIAFRLTRLWVVVPLVEEIFWRGFLLRFLIDEHFEAVPLGTFSWTSFAVVAVLFGFSHAQPDWIVAIITGGIYNLIAYWTKSLLSCVLTHAITNLLLGIWILQTKQWGFW